MSTPTKLGMNWVNVSFTPNGGTAIPITQVTSFGLMRASRQEKFYGDAYAFAIAIKNVERQRGATVTSGNQAQLATIPDDTPGTLIGTLTDPRNGVATGGGAIQVTLVNAVMEKQGTEGQNNKFATGSVSFQCYGGTDGNGNQTDPLSVSMV